MAIKNKPYFLMIGLALIASLLACQLTSPDAPEPAAQPAQPVQPTPISPTAIPPAATLPAAAPQSATPSGVEIRQWATGAKASSEYSNPEWAATQAIGAPNTLECGDIETAWAASDRNSVAWIEVSYARLAWPRQVNIHVSYNPYYIAKVELLDTQGAYHTVYEKDAYGTPACPAIFTVDVQDHSFQATAVKVTINPVDASSWVEIDAVELVGWE